MSKKYSQKSQKDVLKLIEHLSELETTYFKKGVVDALKLLYEQDVTMTNVIGERLEEVKSQLETLKGFMLGIHIATLHRLAFYQLLRSIRSTKNNKTNPFVKAPEKILHYAMIDKMMN